MTSRVDVIIPTHNGWTYLDHCLHALDRQTFTDLRIIVVDDASTDGTSDRLRDGYPSITLLRLSQNVGLAAAVNRALELSNSELVALLNNDTEAEPDWLSNLIDVIDRHSECAAVTSKLLLFDRRDVIHSAGDTYSRSGKPGNRGVWQRDVGQFDKEEEVFGACAGAALYRRSALEGAARIDGAVLDEDFFMYCEDVDLSWRLRLLGGTIVYAPQAVVYHRLSATGGGKLASYYVARNTISVIAKDVPAPILLRNGIRIAAAQVQELVRAVVHAREPAARAQIRGTLAGAIAIPRMLRKRRRIQQTGRVNLAAIERMLSP